ncbi:MAG: DUF2505 family protein [Actinomycetales bacterium]
MPTRVALHQEIEASPGEVFSVLCDHDFQRRRIGLEPQMRAQLVVFDAATGTPGELVLRIEGELPTSWLPPMVPGSPLITRHERWLRYGQGHRCDLRLEVHDLPVWCEGSIDVQPWHQGCLVELVVDVTVNVPVVGVSIERMVRDRLEPALMAELDLLADVLGDVTG